jgi:hypothetical protein
VTERTVQECLVVMPMLKGYEAIREVVARAIAGAGVTMSRLEEILPDAEWQYWLVESVRRADFALADVTDNNPFVMYELGLVHNQQLPSLLIVNSRNEQIPATVLGTPFLSYDEQDLYGFEADLSAAIQTLAQESGTSVRQLGSVGDPYQQALALLQRFRLETSIPVEPVGPDEFRTRLQVAEARGDRGSRKGEGKPVAWYLLSRIISNSDKVKTMNALTTWIGLRGGSLSPAFSRSHGELESDL